MLNFVIMTDNSKNNEQRRFVIGDIHGCYKTLNKMLFHKLKITKDDALYFVGDFIDRGPRSKEVIDLLLELEEQGYSINPIRGNHEEMLVQHYRGESPEDWYYNGAEATLRSFRIRYIYEMDEKYLQFFINLPYYIELDDFIICHAGMNFDIPNPFQDTESMAWTRNDYVDMKKTGGRRLICGHSPHQLEQIKLSINDNKIQLDGGCVYLGRHPGLGFLCAIELKSLQLYNLMNCE
jgi:serine/threonine protein phosphatase 1